MNTAANRRLPEVLRAGRIGESRGTATPAAMVGPPLLARNFGGRRGPDLPDGDRRALSCSSAGPRPAVGTEDRSSPLFSIERERAGQRPTSQEERNRLDPSVGRNLWNGPDDH